MKTLLTTLRRAAFTVATIVATTIVVSPTYALEGQVIDGSTGKPLGGVYVIGAWQVSSPFPVQARTGCAKLEVEQTMSDGRFTLPDHSGRLMARFFGTEDLNVYYYKPGYRWSSGREWKGEAVMMVPDARAPSEHIGEARNVMAKADCGSDDQSKTKRLIIYRVVYEETKNIASSRKEQTAASQILYWVEFLELGESRARENLAKREAEEWAKKER